MTEQGGGVAGLDGMLTADVVAEEVVQAIAEERFLVLPHPEVEQYFRKKRMITHGGFEVCSACSSNLVCPVALRKAVNGTVK